MRCYYEELGISREADDKEIKNSYRKLALRHHPDKNPEHLKEEAKERFQQLQQAYEVLSDPQERAFYDKHREQILRGKNSNYEDNTLDLFQYFTISCFKGYGDDAKGFYAVYREVFQKIAAEDAEFMDDESDGLDGIPEFGNSASTYEDVVGPFYAYWQSYCTKKTYAWLCPYDIQEVKDRRVLRAIDKEMKKVVQNAKRERNEEVRSLVSFVRKRDKRVQAYNRLLEEKAALNRKKQEQNRRDQLLRRQRELEEMRAQGQQVFLEGYEEQLKQLEQEYGADSDSSETDDEDAAAAAACAVAAATGDEDDERYLDFADEFFCVACTKAFKNQNAFDNHALSKKHRDNIERLKFEMLQEEEALSNMKLNNADDDDDHDEHEENGYDSDVKNLEENADDTEGTVDKEADCDKKANARKNKKSKKSKKNISKLMEKSDEEDIDESFMLRQESDKSDNDDWNNSNKKNARKNQNKKQSKSNNKTTEKVPENEPPNSSNPAAAQAATEAADGPTTSIKHTCVTCNATFESKNKLFAHLKKTNHGVYIPKTNSVPESTKTKPKGKKK